MVEPQVQRLPSDRQIEVEAGRDGAPGGARVYLRQGKAIVGVAQAELVAFVVATGPQRAVAAQRQGVPVAARDSDGRPGGRAHVGEGLGLVVGRLETKLASRVVAAAPQAAVALHGHGEPEATGDGRPGVGAAYLGRGVGLVVVAQAKLAVVVVAPAPERAVVLDGQGVVVASRDCLPGRTGVDLGGRCVEVVVSRAQAPADRLSCHPRPTACRCS